MSCPQEHWGMEFTPQEIADCLKDEGLLSLELELSRACNLRCIYCYASSGQPLENELSLDEIFDVIDQAVDMGARKIIVLGGGEPLIYPHIFDVIDYILAKKIVVDLFTNGTYIDEHTARELYSRKVAISLKMNSRTAEVQDILAGKQGTFAAIDRGLTALKSAGYPDKDHTLGIETIVCRQNLEEIPDLWRWARRQCIIPYVEMMTLQGRASENSSLEVSNKEVQALFEELAKIDLKEFGRKWEPLPPLAASRCARHEYSCTVTSVGDVNPCPGVSIAIGNIRKQSLKDMLHTSTVIHELRNIRQTIKGRCSQCTHNKLCYGCRGHAYQVTGDHLAEDPICWINKSKRI